MGIVIAHLCHLLSVFLLFHLSKAVCLDDSERFTDRFALLAAAFHIISPAGIFLSAPYAESAFALFNYTGFYLYIISRKGLQKGHYGIRESMAVVGAGVSFGLATTLRSNGLLSGALFVYDVVGCALSIFSGNYCGFVVRRFCITLATGCVMALGTVVPQYFAYMEYCGASTQDRRPWCSNRVPSIYTWVQKHYW